MAKKSARILQEADFKRLPWRSIGPAIMGGRIADLCFLHDNPKTWFIGYATGGVWRTKNQGTTFQPLFDNEETCSIGSVVACNKDVIWVGTGEGNGRNSSSWGNGVYRTLDGGKSWEHLGLEDSHDIPRLAVDPKNPDVCFVAALGHLWGHNATRGVYRTTNGGKKWERVLELGDDCGACDIIMDPADSQVLYAAMYMRLRTPYSFTSGGEKGGIYKTTDGGKTWKKLSKGLPANTGRIGLDIYAKDPKKLIAVVEATEGGANSIRDDRMRGGGVFRSDDGGQSWRKLSTRSPRAFYFSKIKFDPNDDQRVYMLGWTTEVSDDGGETFRGGVADLLHADHHAMLVNPNDSEHLIIGTDGGVYQSFDKGETWDFLNTMATGQFYNISLDMSKPYRVIGGLQDNGTWVGPSATNKNSKKNEAMKIADTGITNADWLDVFWGDGFHGAFDTQDPNIVYAEWQGGHITKINLETGEKKYLSPDSREGEPKYRYNWNSPFLVSNHEPTVIFHAGNHVFRIDTQSEKWERISPDLTTCDPKKMATDGSAAETHCTVVALSESAKEKGVLWAGSDDGLVHVTRDGGKSWKNVTPPETNGRYISRLEASRHVKGRCYVTIDGHRSNDYDPLIMATDDYGKTWESIAGDLPKNRSAKVIREDLSNPDSVYCGTESALYFSLNRGVNWIKLHGKALPTVPIDDVQLHPREKDLVLGTHGRSIWILDRAQWLSELTEEIIEKPLHLFNLHSASGQWYLDYPGLWTHKAFRAANPPIGLKIDYWISEYANEAVSITIEDSKGVVLKKLSGSNAPGYNRSVWDLVPEEWHQLSDHGEEPAWINTFFARPGKYKVKIEMGDHKAEGEFEITK